HPHHVFLNIFMLPIPMRPTMDGIKRLKHQRLKLATTTGIASTRKCVKKNNAENSLTPRSLRKLNEGMIDFPKKVHEIPAINNKLSSEASNNTSRIMN